MALALSAVLDLDRDEWYSLRTTAHDLAFAYHNAVYFEGISPGYPLLLTLWRHLDASVFFARSLSVAALVVALFCAHRLAARWLPSIAPAWFAGAVALAPFAMFSAVDVRLYAMVLCASSALLLTFYDGYIAERPSRRARVLHAAIAIAGIYVQYYVGAQVVGEACALIALRRSALRAYAASAIIIGIACLPLLPILVGQLTIVRGHSGPFADFHGTLAAIAGFVVPSGRLWPGGRVRDIGFAYPLALACVVLAFAFAKPARSLLVTAQLALVAGTAGVFAIVPPLFHQTLIVPRHLATLVIPTLFAAFAIAATFRRNAAFVRAALFAVYAALATTDLVATYAPLSKEHYRDVARFLDANDRDGTPVYIFDQEMVGMIGFYAHDSSTYRGLPRPQQFERFDLDDFILHSDAEARSGLRAVAPGHRIWLFFSGNCFQRDGSDPFGCRYLRDVVAAEYTTLSTHSFENALVLELRRRANR